MNNTVMILPLKLIQSLTIVFDVYHFITHKWFDTTVTHQFTRVLQSF